MVLWRKKLSKSGTEKTIYEHRQPTGRALLLRVLEVRTNLNRNLDTFLHA
jgi:hypothetical protein